MTSEAISIKNLFFSYQSKLKSNSFILEIDELKIFENDFVSLIGPNGCGKSTLLKLISHLLKPEKGEIKIFDKPINELTQKDIAKYIAYVPQTNYSAFPFSVFEIVMMGRFHNIGLLGFESESDKKIVLDALNEMQILHLANKGIKEISGGEAQRVFIARAIAQQSKIILLDEPTSHLDLEHQILIFEKLEELNRNKGKVIITVSHDLNLISNFSQRIILLKDGKLKLDGHKKDVITQKNIKTFFNVDAQLINAEDENFNLIIKRKI